MPAENATPFAFGEYLHLNGEGHEVVTLAVKATFVLERGALRLADEQAPVRHSDELNDEGKDFGSAIRPADVGYDKPGADIILVGSAVFPRKATVGDTLVKVRQLEVPLRVHGPRLFEWGLSGLVIGQAQAVEEVPIVYEKAYGGMGGDLGTAELRNPAGVGVAQNPRELDGQLAPQIEHPRRPHTSVRDHHEPVGYGPILPYWEPRRLYFGTCDEAWRRNRMPFPPDDFDPRFHQQAHPSLQLDSPLQVGEKIHVLGMSREGLLDVEVPEWRVLVRARYDAGRIVSALPIDTIVIEPALSQLELVGRASFRVGRHNRLRELQIDE